MLILSLLSIIITGWLLEDGVDQVTQICSYQQVLSFIINLLLLILKDCSFLLPY